MIRLCVEDYCQNCTKIKPAAEHFDDLDMRYIDIFCENKEICRAMYENILKQENNTHKRKGVNK